MPEKKEVVVDDWRARAREADALLVKWGAHPVPGLDPKRAEAIGLKVAVKRINYGSSSQELLPMFTHEGSIARYCRRTGELMLQASEHWKQIEANTRETNAYYKQLLTVSRVQEEAYRTATDILSKIMARPGLLNVWECSCPGLLRSKKRELELQKEGTHMYLETLKELTRIELVYDAVVALKKIEQERPIRESDIAVEYNKVAAQSRIESDKIMSQEAALARELRAIGDGTETIVAYSLRLEHCLETNVLSLRKQKLLAAPIEIFQLTHVEFLDLAENKLTELPHELYKLSNTLTLLGIADNPLDHEQLQLYLTGLPVLLAHLKATRPRRVSDSVSVTMREGGVDFVGEYDLFTSALPRYAEPVDEATLKIASLRASLRA
jgi:hypothetical protein